MSWEAVIGIEIHVQLRTATKMFCPCAIPAEGDAPNTRTCPTCLGLPGALPVPNRTAIEKVLAVGAAIGAKSPATTRWDRKNYFYPDLPKGYQISQLDLPLAEHGSIAVTTSAGSGSVRIRRAHLEEDTARLRHEKGADGTRASLIDYNRSGVALLEIVTEPDIRDGETARRYAEELRLLLRTIGAADAEMENGQMRVEANISLRPSSDAPFGTRVEVKNMNSFRSVERAIAYEASRQAEVLDAGGTITQETRGWDEGSETTYTMRAKEDSHDYRYFPEPDLPPLDIDPAWLAAIVAGLPDRHDEIVEPERGHRRHVGQRRLPLRRRHRQRLDIAGARGTDDVDGLVAHEVDLPADDIVERRPRTTIRHAPDLDPDRARQQHAA